MKRTVAWDIPVVGSPIRLEAALIPLEKNLEDWIEADITIAADDVLVIGRQITTEFNTTLDLLGLDGQGDTVIIELKRNQTLRETVAQGIEYASWVADLGRDAILAIAQKKYGSEESFRSEFESTFGAPLPDELNGRQRILLVAPEVTEATARVVEYLSEAYRVPINAVSFDVFAMDNRKVLVRQTVLEEKQMLPPPGAKNRSARTLEEFLDLSGKNNVADIVEQLLTLRDIAPSLETFIQSFALRSKTPDKKFRAAFSIYPTSETLAEAVVLNISADNLSKLYGHSPLETDDFLDGLDSCSEEVSSPWVGWRRFALRELGQAVEFSRRFREFSGVTEVLVGATLPS